jgi:hypothetical protein
MHPVAMQSELGCDSFHSTHHESFFLGLTQLAQSRVLKTVLGNCASDSYDTIDRVINRVSGCGTKRSSHAAKIAEEDNLRGLCLSIFFSFSTEFHFLCAKQDTVAIGGILRRNLKGKLASVTPVA